VLKPSQIIYSGRQIHENQRAEHSVQPDGSPLEAPVEGGGWSRSSHSALSVISDMPPFPAVGGSAPTLPPDYFSFIVGFEE
jgi:hypothetical protein